MVKDHSDNERGNLLLLLHGLLFLISSKGSFICPTDMIAHTTAFVTPVMEDWLEKGNIIATGIYIGYLFSYLLYFCLA